MLKRCDAQSQQSHPPTMPHMHGWRCDCGIRYQISSHHIRGAWGVWSCYSPCTSNLHSHQLMQSAPPQLGATNTDKAPSHGGAPCTLSTDRLLCSPSWDPLTATQCSQPLEHGSVLQKLWVIATLSIKGMTRTSNKVHIFCVLTLLLIPVSIKPLPEWAHGQVTT